MRIWVDPITLILIKVIQLYLRLSYLTDTKDFFSFETGVLFKTDVCFGGTSLDCKAPTVAGELSTNPGMGTDPCDVAIVNGRFKP